MSHQTGITASADLQSFFAESKDGNVRLIKVTLLKLYMSICVVLVSRSNYNFR